MIFLLTFPSSRQANYGRMEFSSMGLSHFHDFYIFISEARTGTTLETTTTNCCLPACRHEYHQEAIINIWRLFLLILWILKCRYEGIPLNSRGSTFAERSPSSTEMRQMKCETISERHLIKAMTLVFSWSRSGTDQERWNNTSKINLMVHSGCSQVQWCFCTWTVSGFGKRTSESRRGWRAV